MRLDSGSTFNNAVDAVFDAQNDERVRTVGGGGTFINEGIIRKSVGTGTSDLIPSAFNNINGTIEVQTGQLDLGAGTRTGGVFNVSSSATLTLVDATTATYQGTFTGSGTGTIVHSANKLTVGTGGATFNFPDGLFNWTAGTISGETLTNASTGFIQLGSTAAKVLSAGTIENQGVWRHIDSGELRIDGGSTFNIPVGGLYDFQGDQRIRNVSSPDGIFVNEGLVRKSGGAGEADLTRSMN